MKLFLCFKASAMSTSGLLILKFQDIERNFIKVKPNLVVVVLGNKINKGMIGIMLSPYNNEIKHVKLGPVKTLVHSLNEFILWQHLH